MATFEQAIGPVLEHEGGFVNHPSDPGGATNHGITLRVLQGFGSLADFNKDGIVDANDIKMMDRGFALEVYHRNYWAPSYDKFPQDVADKVFDMAVNLGPLQAHKLLQRTLGLPADGLLGPITCTAVAACNPRQTRATLRVLQKQFYTALIHNKPSLDAFRNGWMTRADY
jgi:lysozyme family protein